MYQCVHHSPTENKSPSNIIPNFCKNNAIARKGYNWHALMFDHHFCMQSQFLSCDINMVSLLLSLFLFLVLANTWSGLSINSSLFDSYCALIIVFLSSSKWSPHLNGILMFMQQFKKHPTLTVLRSMNWVTSLIQTTPSVFLPISFDLQHRLDQEIISNHYTYDDSLNLLLLCDIPPTMDECTWRHFWGLSTM